MKATITYCAVDLDCTFEFYPAEPRTQWEPGCPAYAALEKCEAGGVNITPLLTNAQQDEIETLIVEAVGEQAEIDAGEHADMRRTERAAEGFLS